MPIDYAEISKGKALSDRKKLTEKQQIAWELQLEGNTYEEIARLMGIKRGVVKKHLRAVRDKMGIVPGTTRFGGER